MIEFFFSCISVSPKGYQFLSSAGPDHQAPLILPVTSEMVDDEDNKHASGEVGEIKSLATVECEGFSEVGNFSTIMFIHLKYLIFSSLSVVILDCIN